MVSIERFFWLFFLLLSFPPSCCFLFPVSVWWKKESEEMEASFCVSQRLVLLLSVSISHRIKHLSLSLSYAGWNYISEFKRKALFFFFSELMTPRFSYLNCLDRTEMETRAWLTAAGCFWGSEIQSSQLCECVCVESVGLWHTVSVATTAKQDFQAHLISNYILKKNPLFFSRKNNRRKCLLKKNYLYVFSQNSF